MHLVKIAAMLREVSRYRLASLVCLNSQHLNGGHTQC